jgi:ADP-ribosylglycohydrolase
VDRSARSHGALLGLAYGDAIGFPALFHRTLQFHERRREKVWRTNLESDREHILRMAMPFTHRTEAHTLEPFPTDDTEYALFTAQTLLAAEDATAETFESAWRDRILPIADQVLTGFSERAAMDNLRRGLRPPDTGSDNPQHYDDSAAARAVAIGLYCAGDAEEAKHLALFDAQVTNAEDGVYAAQAMAIAVSSLSAGSGLEEALGLARRSFPPDSWIEYGDGIARSCREDSSDAQQLLLLLTTRLINTVYSYGNAAPETVPAAFAIAEFCRGDLHDGVLLANAIPKSADSLPALVGALCGAYQGAGAVNAAWQEQLNTSRGLCLPFLRGVRIEDVARGLANATSGALD